MRSDGGGDYDGDENDGQGIVDVRALRIKLHSHTIFTLGSSAAAGTFDKSTGMTAVCFFFARLI